MATAITVEWYRDGKLKVYRLPDGTELRHSSGNAKMALELVQEHYRAAVIAHARLRFHEVKPPWRTPR